MSILSGFFKTKKYRKTDTGYQLQSEWTSASTVEMADGNTAETNLGAIKGITTSLAATDENYALSASAGKDLQDQVNTLNSNLGTKLDTSKIVTTEPKTYTSDENGVIYVNLHSNDIYGVLDADNTSSLTLIPFKGYGYVMLYVINPLTGERVPNASILLTVTYISK